MARSLHLNRLTDAAVFLGVFLVIVGVTAGIYKVYTTADKAHQAICALRADRIRSIEDGQKFLQQHPDGIPGITAADIRRSIDQQQVTVRAFRFADC